ncbi:YGGT family protein [Perilla frutescens var. hirtella]|uniref:YGGT family protein n=1 Tax=Perilla frutescens var. hirtella TaxID=608512 RepID=A0AAD4JPN5_PERFH|nr:YGGT family protein [Perilla frutescens var. hirtella]
MASSLMATPKTLTLHHPIASLRSHRPAATALSLPSAHICRLPLRLAFSPLHKSSKLMISASILPTLQTSPIKPTKSSNADRDLLSGSTRTITTLHAVAEAASKFFAHEISCMAVQLREPALSSAGTAFFAAMKEDPTRGLNTPFTVVAAGMAKWLDIYSGVLMVRVMLSWFPNIPWEKQPLSAIRDLCDPYLNLFRNIIPPIFDQLDVSPLLGFAVLGTMGSILNSSRQAY